MFRTPFRKAGLLEQFRDLDGCERHFFARFEHEGISTDQGGRIHPQRDHCREIERGNPDACSQRLPDGIAVNSARDVSRLSPISSEGTPQANSIISIPRFTSPRDSTKVFPCSRVLQRTSSSKFSSSSILNLKKIRARSTGGVSIQAGNAAAAASTAALTC